MVYDKVIEGLTVRLRPIEEKDAEISYKMRTDPEKAQFLHKDQGGIEQQRQYIISQRSKPGDYYFVIEDLEGKPIGLKGFSDYNEETGEIESGRFLGYGSQIQNMEALMLGFDFAFQALRVKRICMNALENNIGMLSIQKRFGAEYTHRFHEEGMAYDNLCSVLTREKYETTRPKIYTLIKRFADR